MPSAPTAIPIASPPSRAAPIPSSTHAHSPARPSPLSASLQTGPSFVQANAATSGLANNSGMKRSNSLLSLAKLSIGGNKDSSNGGRPTATANNPTTTSSPVTTNGPPPVCGPTSQDIASVIFPGLLLGSLEAANNREFLEREGVTHVLTVAGDLPVKGEDFYQQLKIQHLRIPALDNALWSMSGFLRAGSEWIETALEPRYSVLMAPPTPAGTPPIYSSSPANPPSFRAATPDSFDSERSGASSTLVSAISPSRAGSANLALSVSSSPSKGTPTFLPTPDSRTPVVLVHCALGRSRSPTMIAGHLITLSRLRPSLFLAITENQLSLDCGPTDILDWLHERREGIRPNGMFVKNLHAWCGKMDLVAEHGWDALSASGPRGNLARTSSGTNLNVMKGKTSSTPIAMPLNRTIGATSNSGTSSLSSSMGKGSLMKGLGKFFGTPPST